MEEAGAAGSALPGDGAPGKGRPLQPPAKGRELFRSQRKESEGSVDCPSVEFEYGDADGYTAELSELYSYTEEPEFTINRKCFEEDFQTQAGVPAALGSLHNERREGSRERWLTRPGWAISQCPMSWLCPTGTIVQGKRWPELDQAQQKAYVMRLLDGLEVVDRDKRLKAARAVLYLAQGVFGECDMEAEVLHWSRHNNFLLYQMGTFSAFLELLNMEIDNSQACSSALRKPAISLADSTELRVLLSVLYLMVENIRVEAEADPPEWQSSRETFRTELSFPVHSEEPFALLLFTMVAKFCSGHAPHFPMKKVLLLLWKVLLHKYVSISDVQIKNEEELEKCPMSLGEEEVQETPCEMLYRAMLYNLPQYMIALLKILLAAAPTSKAKTDSINILADVLPEEMPITVLQSMKLGVDVNRHKEIIVKSISASLLLLLKHFKLNHIYQFEYVSQHLVFANCIPLILKFFNQNIMSYITAKNSISVLDYPHCTVHELPELTAESLEAGDNHQFCWRNLFSCINLLRLLNKLTKWKHSRTMMLVVFKSAPILKRALKVKQAMMQLYVLKLLKIQTKYLGRQWRKSNMKTMSAIYQKVRHRMNDDWAYGNDIDARPWDFQAEECTLRANIEAFNSRRYDKSQDSEFAPVDNCLQSVLGQQLELPEDFHYSYELWLEREVFSQPIRWEELLHYQ
ncbi:striatin-interacting protein 2 isoform X3 [Chrysemys picta bellii]|uniref:striatin-interacting protein 2 isoform X3 n=1 Tax=Chrysemys picta bellii TaxID=8478 RepID=UPI0032B118A3